MTPLVPRNFWAIATGVALAASAAVAGWNPRVALSVVAGAAWNLASLWCLAHLLAVWLGSRAPAGAPSGRQVSRRRAIGWLIVKFPLLYLLLIAILRHPAVSLVGFGLGFTVVLVAAIAVLALHAQRTFAARSS